MKQLPPGPTDRIFGLSIARRFQTEPLEFITSLGRDYGDAAAWRMGPQQSLFINHPDLVREVLVTKAKSFRKVERIKRGFRAIDGNGLILSEGDFWLRQRRLVQPAFHHTRLAHYAALTVDYTRRMLDRWNANAPIDICAEMTRLTCALIAKMMFDVELTGKAAQLGEAVHTISEIATREMGTAFVLPDWLPLPEKRRKRWAIGVLDGVVREVIAKRRASKEDKGDLLSMLLLAVDDQGDGRGMTDEQARDEAMTMFNAGHDTTAAALAWTWYLLATHPKVQQKLCDEVDETLKGQPATFADLPKLTYTEMVVKESLRLHPPTWALFVRENTEEVRIGEFVLPKNTWVYIFPWVIQRTAKFFPNPEQFDPERFSPERSDEVPQYAYLPFGAGPHICIGKSLATMEMSLIVPTVLQRFRVELSPDQPPVVPEPFLSLRPTGGLRVRLSPYSASAPSHALASGT